LQIIQEECLHHLFTSGILELQALDGHSQKRKEEEQQQQEEEEAPAEKRKPSSCSRAFFLFSMLLFLLEEQCMDHWNAEPFFINSCASSLDNERLFKYTPLLFLPSLCFISDEIRFFESDYIDIRQN
jgi:hypothetical protein